MKQIMPYVSTLLLLLISIMPIAMLAETFVPYEGISVSYMKLADGGIKITDVINKSSYRFEISIDGETLTYPPNSEGSSGKPNKFAYKLVRYDISKKGGGTMWKYTPPDKEEIAEDAVEVNSVEDEIVADNATVQPARSRKGTRSAPNNGYGNPTSVNYFKLVDEDEYFGNDAVDAYVTRTNSYSDALDKSSNKKQYIIDNDLEQYLRESQVMLVEKKAQIPLLAQDIATQAQSLVSDTELVVNYVVQTFNNRLRIRQEAHDRLDKAVKSALNDETGGSQLLSSEMINYAVIAIIALALIVWIVIVMSRKKKKKPGKAAGNKSTTSTNGSNSDAPSIIVRRRTTSILKKQSLDDVVNNPAYMLIESAEFSPNSAVRRIYVKNTCIREIYNLYAEDLRNAEKPKEDGCMVLGRWVYDKDNNVYDVSLEEVVYPGDDAVFKEYELNFGGITSMRVWKQLHKLRNTTGLQYDLTCWVHSHPGIGVFFSNYDNTVQMQLKHYQHPNFLTAFVVDILTPEQQLGIFTFRSDGTINSKNDLTKLYSLEDMNKWALDSGRKSFVPDNYYNILASATHKNVSCLGIELNNNAIIDLMQITMEGNTGLMGWASGFTLKESDECRYVVSGIVKDEEKPASGAMGCLVVLTHMSLPTIQRIVETKCGNIYFIMIYSIKLATLTSIPVVNGEIMTDESFYGDVAIDELTKWTRRKR